MAQLNIGILYIWNLIAIHLQIVNSIGCLQTFTWEWLEIITAIHLQLLRKQVAINFHQLYLQNQLQLP